MELKQTREGLQQQRSECVDLRMRARRDEIIAMNKLFRAHQACERADLALHEAELALREAWEYRCKHVDIGRKAAEDAFAAATTTCDQARRRHDEVYATWREAQAYFYETSIYYRDKCYDVVQVQIAHTRQTASIQV